MMTRFVSNGVRPSDDQDAAFTDNLQKSEWRLTAARLASTVVIVWSALSAQTARAQSVDPTASSLRTVLSAIPTKGSGTGLLPTALAEAQSATSQAKRAVDASGDLAAMRQYAGNVLYAVDPTLAKSGVSLGYGVKRATQEILNQLTPLGADTKADSTRLVPPGVDAAHNVLAWCDELTVLAQRLRAATDTKDAAALATQVFQLARQLTVGKDVDGDGKVTFAPGEGGLNAVRIATGVLLGSRDAASKVSQTSERVR
jgi:hypothetical protein